MVFKLFHLNLSFIKLQKLKRICSWTNIELKILHKIPECFKQFSKSGISRKISRKESKKSLRYCQIKA